MRASSAIKSAMTSSNQRSKSDNKSIINEGFKLSIASMEYETTRERHLKDPIIRDLGFDMIVTPVVSKIERNGRKDLALGNGMSLSLLLFRRKVIIDDESGESEMELDPKGNTRRGEYHILESGKIPEMVILQGKMLVGLVYKTYINKYGDPSNFSPEAAALIAAALSNNNRAIGAYRDDSSFGKDLMTGFATPSDNLLLLEKLLGIATEGLDPISRIVYWTGLLLGDSKDPYQIFKNGHILVTSATKLNGSITVGHRHLAWEKGRKSLVLERSPDFNGPVQGTIYLDNLKEQEVMIYPQETIFHRMDITSQLTDDENDKNLMNHFDHDNLINSIEGWLYTKITEAVRDRKW